MRLKDKREQRTIEPSRFALGIPAMDKRNDALGSKAHVQAGVNTRDLDLVSMTNGDYINSRIGGHTSTFSREQLNKILHASPSSPGETYGADEPPVELDAPVVGGVEGGEGEGSREADVPMASGVARIEDLNTSLRDVTGAVSTKAVYQKVSELYVNSMTGITLKPTRNGAEIRVAGDTLEDATIPNLEIAINVIKELKKGAEGKAKERISSDLRKLKRTLKTKLASKPSSSEASSGEADDEGNK
jgi:hypothetical protein